MSGDDASEAAAALLPTLVVLATVVMTLEILQRLLLARCVAVALMGAIWSAFFARELQVKAMLAALVYHGAFELVHAYRGQSSRRERDRKVIFTLLYLVRVFIWGAAFAAASSFQVTVTPSPATPTSASADADRIISSSALQVAALLLTQWRDACVCAASRIVALVVYCEVLEVLVLLYFADEDVPYDWRRRALLWQLAAGVGVCEASGVLPLAARALVPRVSPLVLVAALLAVLWLAPHLPWQRIAGGRRIANPRSRKSGLHDRYGDDSGDTEELSDELLEGADALAWRHRGAELDAPSE